MPPSQEIPPQGSHYALREAISHNTTSPLGQPPNTVSWQSAFWPVVACTLAVILQNTGRVLEGSSSDSFTLRSSPLICIADTLASLIKLVVLKAKGCSFRTAARHVWYDRFEESNIDSHEPALRRSLCLSTTTSPVSQPHQKSAGASAILGTAHETEEDHTCSGALPMTDIFTSIAVISKHPSDSTATTPNIPSTVPSTTIGAGAEDIGGDDQPHVDDEPQAQHIEHGPCLETLSSIQLASEAVKNAATPEVLPLGASEHKTNLPGSDIDRTWRYTMAAFALGALPQSVKVFCMKGIPLTQILVAFCVVSFIVFELFRFIAGPAGAVDLRPLPIITKAKESLVELQYFLLGLGLLATVLGLGFTSLRLSLAGDRGLTFAFALELPSLATVVVLLIEQPISMLVTELPSALPRSTMTRWLSKRTIGPKSCGMFSIEHSPVSGNVPSTSTKHRILKGLALSPSTSGLHVVLVVLFVPIVLVSTLLAALSQRKTRLEDTGGHLIMILSSLTPGVSLLAALHILFRLSFMGSLSTKPRALFALQGTISEFLAAAFLATNFLTTFFCYMWHLNGEPFYKGTYQPSWTEYLG